MKTKVFSQSLGLLLFGVIVAFGAFTVGATVMVSGLVGAGSMALPFFTNTANSGMPAFWVANPDVSALAAYAGTYEKALFRSLVNAMEFRSQVGTILNVKGKLNMTKLVTTANVRPYSSTEHMQGTLVYQPRVLETSRGKAEFPLDPIEYRDTWLAELMNREITAKELPFAQFVMDSIMESVGAEINNRTFYFGFDKADAVAFDAGDTYAAGDYITYTPAGGVLHYYKCLATTTAGQDPEDTPAKWQEVDAEAFFPGLKVLIEDEVTANNITDVSTGVVNSGSTALAAFKELFRALPAPYKTRGAAIFASHTDYEYLLDGISDKFHQYSGNQDGANKVLYLPDTDRKCMILPATWLNGSRRLICTDPKNIVFGTNLLSDFNSIKIVESQLWSIKMGLAFEGGVQIRDLDGIVVGDQA